MKKKLLAILLTVCMVLSMAPAALAAGSVFTDVNAGDWFAEEVEYVYDNGLMNGVGDNAFDPSGTVTRAMVWTTLARLDGVNTAGSDPWWLAGQKWAMENGISDGTMAENNITREQLVTMIWRYAKYIDMDVSEGEDTNILSYTDAFDVNEWAIPAMQWACAVGIINGIDGALQPQGDASRAQLAAILYRFVEEVVPEEEPVTPSVPSYPSYPVIPPHSHSYTASYTSKYDGTHVAACTCGAAKTEDCKYVEGGDTCECGYNRYADYSVIDTAEDLMAFAEAINAGNDYSGKTVILTADIDLTGETWVPIGTAENAFAGTFDGNGKTISNLKIEAGDFTGLFGYVSDATIKNVVLEDAQVSGGERVGALIGRITGDAVVSDCSVVGDSTVAGSDSNTGGLIGEIVNGEVELTNLVNNAAVENTKSSNSRAGGIVGQVTTNANVTLIDCVNNGVVKTNNGYAGGIVSAYQSGTLTLDNCVNTGDLDGAYEGNMLGWYTDVRSITISSEGNVFDVNAIGCVDISISSNMSLYGKNYFVNKKAELTGVDSTKQTFSEIFAEGEIGTSPKELWDKLIGFFAYAKSKNSAFAGSPETYWEMFDISVIGYSEPDWNSYFEGYNAQCEEANKVEKADFTDASWREKIVYLAPQHDEHIYNYNSNGDGTHHGLCACGVTTDDVACVFVDGACVDCGYDTIAAVQATLDAATPGTVIQLSEGVDYGTLYLRPIDGSPATKAVDWQDNNYGFESYSCFENLTIIGAVGASVDAIVIEGGTYYNTDHSQAATYPVMLSLVELKNVVIDGVTFTGEGGYDPQGYGNVINLSGNNIKVDGLTLKNCVLNSENKNARLVYKTESTTYVHTYVYDEQTYTFVPSLKDITVTGCTFNGGYMGLELRETENVTITDNSFNNLSSRNILLPTNSGCTYSGSVTITGNTSDGAVERFVRADQIGNAKLIITDNIIKNYKSSDADYIKVTGATGDTTIENNTLVSVGSAAAAQAMLDAATSGTVIQLAPNVNYGTLVIRPVDGQANTTTSLNEADGEGYTIYRNEFLRKVENLTIIGATGATVDAIVVESGYIADSGSSCNLVNVKNLVIDSVEFNDTYTNEPHSYAAPVFFDLSYADVDGLTVKNCKLVGDNDKMNLVYFYSSGKVAFDNVASNITITGNTVEGIARLCELRQTENVTITNNTIKNTALHGMLLTVNEGTFSGDVIITGNTAEGINDRFVRMAGAGDANIVITDNTVTNYRGEDADYIKVTDSTGTPTIENNTCQ